MRDNRKTTELMAIAIVCALGCLAIEAVAYAVGWTKTIGEATINWLAYSAVTSLVVITLSKRKSDK